MSTGSTVGTGSSLTSTVDHAMAADIDQRGLDLPAPVWHLLDLTPQGRGDWYAELSYLSRP